MKLSELQAIFIRHEARVEPQRIKQEDGSVQLVKSRVDYFIPCEFSEAHGIRFLCPKSFAANGGVEGTHSVQIFFSGSPVPDHLGVDAENKPTRWERVGTSGEDLTLSPSIQEIDERCGWHGYVREGSTVDA